MKVRQNEVFGTPFMAAAILLDPRFKAHTANRKREDGIIEIKKMFRYVEELENLNVPDDGNHI